MIIALTTSGEELSSPLDQRFGRTPKIFVYDSEQNSHTTIDNTVNLNAVQGAGIQTAQNVAKSGAEIIITGHCGPKAFRVLSKAGITIYLSQAKTIQDAINQYNNGELQPVKNADVEGHWI